MFVLSRPCFTFSAFLVHKQILNRLGRVVPTIAVVAVLGMCAPMAWAAPQATNTVLAVTAGGTPVTTVAQGTVVTLTATVTAGSTPVTPGTVNFCDAAALSCTDIHRVGTAQLTSAGVAMVRFRPTMGTHSYKAVFVGTNAYAASSSAASSLAMTVAINMALTSSGAAGSYGLSGTVVVPAQLAPTGTISFQDITNGNYVLGTNAPGAQAIHLSYDTTTTPAPGGGSSYGYQVVAADLNQDGIPDLITPNGNVQVFLGNGDGTFTAAATISAVSGASAVAVGDFNSDGKLDLAVVSNNSNSVTVLLGNGDGTFTQPGSSLATGNGPGRVAIGDFNGDGNLDLAVVNFSDNTITILLGKGDGTFSPMAPMSTPLYPNDILSGDFNGDGKVDLAISNSYYASGCVNVFLGKGDGTFTSTARFISGTNSCYSVVAADINHDGNLDLLATDFDQRVTWVVLGAGNGTFSVKGQVGIYNPSSSLPEAVAVGDFNGDGIVDFAMTGEGTAFTIATGNGDGTFTPFPIATSGTYIGVAVADFNGDGLADTAVRGGNATIYTSGVSETFLDSLGPVSPAGIGIHQVQAVYAGDATYRAATSNTVSLTAQAATTTVSLTLNPASGSNYGQQVVLNATLKPYPAQGHTNDGETVAFYNGNTPLGTANLATGVASLNVTSLGAGVNSLKAVYSGDTNFAAGASSTVSYDVTYPTTLTLTANPTSSTYGQPVTVTATLSPAAMSPQTTDGEIVTFRNGPTILGTATLSSGVANFTLPTISASTASLSASYASDSYFASATSSAVPFTIHQATPALTWVPTPSSVVYTGRGVGTMIFNASSATSGAITYSATPASGSAFAINSGTIFAAGSYTLTATLTPTDKIDYSNGSVSIPFIVTPAVLTVVPQNISRAYGTANPNLTGSVTGALNSDAFVVTGATAAGTTSSVGAYPIAYTVTGSNLANYAVTPATGTLTVGQASPAITWNAPAAVMYGTALSAAQLNATASTAGTFSYSPALGTVLGAGTQTLSVIFAPTDTTDYTTPSASTVALTVYKAPLTIVANNAARVFGAANPVFGGTVSGAVNGDVFTESFATSATAASIAGIYAIVPAVVGANLANYAVTATNGALTITQAGTATTFALSNSNLTMTATVLSLTSGTPTGNVAFYQGQTLVGTGVLANGTATFTTTNFPAGNVVVSAQYSGDANFTQSASPPIFVLTVNPAQTQLTVGPAGSVSDALTLTAANGFTGTLQFSCGGLPAEATCSFSPGSYTFTGNSNSASVTMTVQTGVSASAGQGPLARPGLTALAGVLCVPLLVLLGGRRRPRVQLLIFALLLGGACGLVTACGSTPQTPAGTSTVQVVTSGASGFQQTTSVALTVQ
jgi:hypothetical protein